jgi:hypothetical protein
MQERNQQQPAQPINPASKRIATIEGTSRLYPFTPAALRDLKFRAFDRKNSRGETIQGNGTGAAGVWLQVGRKVLVDLDRFDKWLEGHRSAEGTK